ACLEESLTDSIPLQNCHVTSSLSLGSHLRLTPFVQLAIASGDLSSTHLLRFSVLDVAHPDQSEQTVEMPVLSFPIDAESDHPIVNKLGSNDFAGLRRTWCRMKPRSSHLCVNVI